MGAFTYVRSYPVQYKGRIINYIFKIGADDLVKSWDVVFQNLILNGMEESKLREIGFDSKDIDILNQRAQQEVDAREGRTIGSSSSLF